MFDYRVLGARIRDQERKMITMGSETGHVSHDITPIHKVLACWVFSHCVEILIDLIAQVDEEDLPSNMEGMEREELQCVAASYGIDFDDKADVKVDGSRCLAAFSNLFPTQMDLVKKLERARLKGSGLMMITDEVEKKKKKKKAGGKKRKNESESESDSDFNPDDD